MISQNNSLWKIFLNLTNLSFLLCSKITSLKIIIFRFFLTSPSNASKYRFIFPIYSGLNSPILSSNATKHDNHLFQFLKQSSSSSPVLIFENLFRYHSLVHQGTLKHICLKINYVFLVLLFELPATYCHLKA